MTEVEAPRAGAQSDSTTRIDERKLQIGCWIVLIAIATVRAWFTRYEYEGDAVSYLDIGRAIAEGHPDAAINAFWSPGYPALLSIFLGLFRPNAFWECPLIHFVNVLIFVGALAAFQMFWSEVRLCHENDTGNNGAKIAQGAFWAIGYAALASRRLT